MSASPNIADSFELQLLSFDGYAREALRDALALFAFDGVLGIELAAGSECALAMAGDTFAVVSREGWVDPIPNGETYFLDRYAQLAPPLSTGDCGGKLLTQADLLRCRTGATVRLQDFVTGDAAEALAELRSALGAT